MKPQHHKTLLQDVNGQKKVMHSLAQQMSSSTTYTFEQSGSESHEQTLQEVKEVRAAIESTAKSISTEITVISSWLRRIYPGETVSTEEPFTALEALGVAKCKGL